MRYKMVMLFFDSPLGSLTFRARSIINFRIEEPMTYKQTITACALLMLSFSTSLVFAATDTQRSSKIQWQVEKTWKLPSTPLDIVYSLDGKRVFILTDQKEVLAYTDKGELLGSIPVTKGVSAIDIAPRGEKLFLINQAENSFSDLSVNFIVNIDTTGSPFLGNENAPVTIAVFTDFE
jgi:DNA-binding beta-propeller fold protein YncE